jgi:flavin-binding protein dodecin
LTVVKVVELVADSPSGWQDAIEKAVERAANTIDDISGVEVKNLTASVENGKVTEYKADLHIAFKIHDQADK